jgi:hypothetical protein
MKGDDIYFELIGKLRIVGGEISGPPSTSSIHDMSASQEGCQ